MLIISQLQIDAMIKSLATKIILSGSHLTNVVGIANGGLHISRPLAVRLGLPHSSVRISHYDNQIQHAIPLIIEGCLPQKTRNLVVDDLIDDGLTMRTFAKYFGLEENETAVLFCKKGSFIPTYFVAEKPNEWIYFPWDN